ncbi:MAG: hypothetical protein ACM30G_17825, partial [Micromonosporaceae bacterium]
MGIRTWTRLAGNSFGAAAVVAAAQLGIGYGLHIVDWGQRFDLGNDNAWHALLTWTAFITAVAVLGGAAAGGPGITRPSRRVSFPARLTAAVAASLGALSAVPLAWLPARVARPDTPVNPGTSVLMAAGAGAVVGLLLALAALSAATVAGGLAAAVTWVWGAALAAAVVATMHGDPVGRPRLGLIEMPRLVPPTAWWLGPELLVGVGVALSVAVAGLARRRGMGWLGVVSSGVAGPALIAAAYLIAGPGDGTYQRQPYLAATLGAAAGLAATILIAVVRPRRKTSGNATSSSVGAGAKAAKPAAKGASGAAIAKGTTAAGAATAAAKGATPTTAAKATRSAAAAPAGALAAAKGEPGHTSVFRVQLDTLERPGASRGSRGSRDAVKAGSDRKPAAKTPAAAPPAGPNAHVAPIEPKAPAKGLLAERTSEHPPAGREPARREPARTGRGKPEPAKPAPRKPDRSESLPSEPVKVESKTGATKTGTARAGATKAGATKAGATKTEPAGPEASRSQPGRPEPARPDVKSVKPESGRPEQVK